MRVPINLSKYKQSSLRVVCPQCTGVVTPVGNKQTSLIWYCAKCDTYQETTPRGVALRSYRKPVDQVINISMRGE